MHQRKLLVASLLLPGLANEALADRTCTLATGRRDPRIDAIDLGRALRAQNDNPPNAIVTVVSGGPRLNQFEGSATVWAIDLHTRSVVAAVTGVGNDPHGLALVQAGDD